MDSTALHELIAQVRGTAAALAEAEQRVASFTAELAQQDRSVQSPANSAQQIWTRISKGGSSG
jgi:ABC-type transporter Mla subunit MlaD